MKCYFKIIVVALETVVSIVDEEATLDLVLPQKGSKKAAISYTSELSSPVSLLVIAVTWALEWSFILDCSLFLFPLVPNIVSSEVQPQNICFVSKFFF